MVARVIQWANDNAEADVDDDSDDDVDVTAADDFWVQSGIRETEHSAHHGLD